MLTFKLSAYVTCEGIMGDHEIQPVKKRLMIREMVLENFKSYAGIQHVGPFHKVSQHIVDVLY